MTVEWRLRDRRKHAIGFTAGGNGHVDVPNAADYNNPGTASFTVSFVVDGDFSTSSDTFPRAFDTSDGSSSQVGYWGRNDKPDSYFRIDTTLTNRAADHSYPNAFAEPTRITCVVDRSTEEARFFEGSTLAATDALPAGEAIDLSFDDFQIGYDGSNLNPDLAVDSFGWWNAALTEQEVVELDAGEYPGHDLALLYRFDAGEGTTAVDDSGNGNDGTLVNSPAWAAGIAPDTFDDRLVDVPDCTLAYNRFARSATALLDDPDGVVADDYPHPTPVQLEVKRDIDSGWKTRFGGFVANPGRGYRDPETGESTGLASLELLSHDFWLRKRDVYRDYTATAKTTILEDLIRDLTPLAWDAARVDVVDDDAIDVSWRGTRLDKAIGGVLGASTGELFGADADMVFFVDERDTARSPRDFTEGEYFDANFDEDHTYELNEVTVYYGGDPASNAVVVEDRESQRSTAGTIGASSNVVVSDSKTYTNISTEDEAVRKGEEILDGATGILTGELETWEGYGIEPGDVARVVVPEQGIDGEYRVAEISHSWHDDTTKVKLAENSEGVVDTLVELSDEVSRLDARAADANATITRFTELELPFEIALELTAYRRDVPADQLLFGSHKGGWGDPRAGGGRWGDQRSQATQINLG